MADANAWYEKSKWGRPVRWLRALVLLPRTHARALEVLITHQNIGELAEKLVGLEAELKAELKASADALCAGMDALDTRQVQSQKAISDLNDFTAQYKKSMDFPFMMESDGSGWLERSVRKLDVYVEDLTASEKHASFYSFYSEMGGDQSSVMQAHFEAYFGYLPQTSKSAVLDVGCGAGEFLQYLEKNGRSAVGVDLDAHEVERCLAKGYDVRCENALPFLESKKNTFAAITCFQVIEHMPWSDVQGFAAKAYSALEENGCCIIETVNLRHPLAMNGFFTDPTHQLPLADNLLCFLLEWVGFKNVKLLYLHPDQMSGTSRCEPERIYQNYAVIGYKAAQ
jgi:2-polyprenyl-3-methyl-5-hydroxy-6-metoxy-1,4-benzoquinol methylase